MLDAFVAKRAAGAAELVGLADTLDAEALAPEASAFLRATAQRVAEGRFVVLLLGCFSSGKSTLLNALLGQPVLPVKVNPCTAILTEVVYGESSGVDIRFADGSVEELDVATFVERYQLRTGETEAGTEAQDRFGSIDRAVVRWPLPILQHGVVLLDTPGLDDDPARTARTLSSLPDADAVIFVLSATRFLSELERRTLHRDLLPLGLRNLFFPTTMVDLLERLSDQPEADLANLTERARKTLGELTRIDGEDRFEDRFFPLDARGALHARWDRKAGERLAEPNTSELEATGLASFEEDLERFLIEERGAAQLHHLHSTALRIRAELSAAATVDAATADQSLEDLRQRHDVLAPRLEELATMSTRVSRTVHGFIARQKQWVWQDLRAFMASAELELPEAAAAFDLGGLASLDLLTPGGRAKVETALHTQLESWLDAKVQEWQEGLRPKLEVLLDELRHELVADADAFEAMRREIVTDFVGEAFELPVPMGAEDVDPAERWFSVALGAVLLSPGTMAAGWSQGYAGALKGAASRIGVRLALLTLGTLLGPIGWAGIAMYAVSDAVLLALTGGSQLRRLREQIATKLRGQLVGQVDAHREDIEERVAQGLVPLHDALVEAASQEAIELRTILERTLAAREQAISDAASRAESYANTLAAFDEAIERLA